VKDARRSTSGRRAGQRFDATYNVVTEALIFLGELDPEEIGDAMVDATHYEPTPLADAHALLDAVPLAPRQAAFVDIGAGMGRMMLLASQRPFRQIVGVEVSPALCEVARDNIARWRAHRPELACNDLRVICADAAVAALPHGDAVYYLFNPFGEDRVQRIAERIAGETGEIYALYHTPLHRHAFEENAAFELFADLGFGAIYRKRPLRVP
jgi:SAM-dependent methyltransferase